MIEQLKTIIKNKEGKMVRENLCIFCVNHNEYLSDVWICVKCKIPLQFQNKFKNYFIKEWQMKKFKNFDFYIEDDDTIEVCNVCYITHFEKNVEQIINIYRSILETSDKVKNLMKEQ